MNDEFVAEITMYRGEDEYIPDSPILCCITDVDGDNVQIGFDLPNKRNERIYITLPLAEVVRRVLLR